MKYRMLLLYVLIPLLLLVVFDCDSSALWSQVDLGDNTGDLVDVWGTAKDDVYIIGEDGVLIHLSKNKINIYYSDNDSKFKKILGLYRQGLIIETNNDYQLFNGISFVSIPGTIIHGTKYVYCGGSAFINVEDGIQCEDSETTMVDSYDDFYIKDMWSDGNIIAAVGFHEDYDSVFATFDYYEKALIFTCDSCSSYTSENVGGVEEIFPHRGQDSGIVRGFTDVWGISSDRIYAVGYDMSWGFWFGNGNSGIFFRYMGDGWESVSLPELTSPLSRVHGCAPDFVIAVGEDGTILFYDGMELSKMDSGTRVNLNAVWVASRNLAFAVGDDFTILRYSNRLTEDASQPIEAVYAK